MAKSTAREGRRGATFPPVETGEPVAQPNQRLPKSYSGGRKDCDAYQGEREREADASPRKPGQ
jgi:hypothetical protein